MPLRPNHYTPKDTTKAVNLAQTIVYPQKIILTPPRLKMIQQNLHITRIKHRNSYCDSVTRERERERFGATPGNDVFESVSALYSNLSQKNNLHFIQEKTSDKEP